MTKILSAPQKTSVKQDPEDDKFLEAAIEGKAKYIISGYNLLKHLKKFKGIKILSVDDFLKKME